MTPSSSPGTMGHQKYARKLWADFSLLSSTTPDSRNTPPPPIILQTTLDIVEVLFQGLNRACPSISGTIAEKMIINLSAPKAIFAIAIAKFPSQGENRCDSANSKRKLRSFWGISLRCDPCEGKSLRLRFWWAQIIN